MTALQRRQFHTPNGECTSNCRRESCPEEYKEAMEEFECIETDKHLKACNKHNNHSTK